tara:strand:- start:369 stop:536 length:168 start_codon:yes stop_codon:yes gene_type:complete
MEEEEFRIGKVIFKNRHIRFNITFDCYSKETGKKHKIIISYKPFLFAEPSNKKKH